MNRRKTILFWVISLWILCMLSAACGDSRAKENERKSGKPAVAVEVAPVSQGDLREAIDVVGSLGAKFSADVKSEVTALVAEVYVTEWVEVKRGTPLARLVLREEEATVEALKASVLQAKVAETRSLRELERALKLKEAGLITQQGLDDARTARDAAEAATKAAEAQLRAAQARVSKSLILSPMDGMISYRGVSVGDRVENMGSDNPMFRVVDNRILDLTVSVPSVKMASVKIGQPLVFAVDSFPGKVFTGKVMFINPSLDSANRTVKVVAEVRNDDRLLRGGLFVKGRIDTGMRQGVLQIPRSSLLNWNLTENSADVFVVNEDRGELRRVRTGAASGDFVEITSGLAPGDRVVTRGAFNLRSGDRVRVVTGQGA
ncbi:MAG: efflux RND transporter periplasmic adaptor subunit [Thermodesulfobacteriota bacterium]